MTEKKKPWILKYKPKIFDDFVYHDNIVNIIKNSLTNLPHIIFYGPNGVGKTCLVKIIINSIYKSHTIRRNVLQLSAGDQRGIGIVRKEIKAFAKQSVYLNEGCFKLVILDEVDSMSFEAQSALRRIMETYSKTTRFCFICNSINKVSNPIVSRCVKFLFKQIPKEYIEKRLMYIAKSENLSKIKLNVISKICEISNGDLRKSINLFEMLSNSNENWDNLINDLNYLTGKIDDELINRLLNVITDENFDKILDFILEIFYQGYSPKDILLSIFENILKNDQISDNNKKKIFKYLSSTDKSISAGGNQNLNILNFCYKYLDIIKK